MDYILETNNLTKIYGQKEAAKDVNLHIKEGLIYAGINEALKPIFGQGTDISRYMPDTVMGGKTLDTLKSLAVSFAWGGLFLLLAIRVFDRKDVN